MYLLFVHINIMEDKCRNAKAGLVLTGAVIYKV